MSLMMLRAPEAGSTVSWAPGLRTRTLSCDEKSLPCSPPSVRSPARGRRRHCSSDDRKGEHPQPPLIMEDAVSGIIGHEDLSRVTFPRTYPAENGSIRAMAIGA